MMDVTSLYNEHRNIIELCDSLQRLLVSPTPPALADLSRLRWRISSSITRHMTAEDVIAYQPLLGSNDPAVKAALEKYIVSHRRLRGDLAELNSAWPNPKIIGNWAAFGREFAREVVALKAFMQWEEQEFYPLAARYLAHCQQSGQSPSSSRTS